jgi:small nuclear ribonucleoprotein (snRNP)-like protein
MNWKEWKGKRVFVVLKSGRNYSGVINDVDDTSIPIFIEMNDKFNKKVVFVSSEILKIIEEDEEWMRQ